MSLGYLLTGNPLASALSHAAMHVAPVLHGPSSVVQLPPHYEPPRYELERTTLTLGEEAQLPRLSRRRTVRSRRPRQKGGMVSADVIPVRPAKKVVAFVGSARKRHTYDATQQLMSNLQSLGDVECEVIALSDCEIGICRGCKLCLDKGEELCPLEDDRDALIQKMLSADGVVFASPVYSFQVSAITKAFLDRLGFVFHRPRFFGKAFTSIVVQGIYGGTKVVKYLDFVGNGLGFTTVKGSCITSLEPMTAKQQRKTDLALAKQSKRFYKKLLEPAPPVPSLSKLMIFRMSRTSLRLILDDSWQDYRHYRDHGWFESDYYYPAHLGPVKKLAGSVFDSFAASRARSRDS